MSWDTIAAIATPSGKGGVGIIRVSGPKTPDIAKELLGELPKPRFATLSDFKEEGEIIDNGLSIYFPKPHSFTGEDVLELQGHGGPLVMNLLLQAVLKQGARLANPGEFSERAFLNDKIDLTQAEAIADLIDASTQHAALSASRSLQGVFSNKIEEIASSLVSLRLFIEAAIDFPDEEIEFLNEENILKKIQAINDKLDLLLDKTKQGKILNDGISVVIVGRPNAGKSSLLNCLTQNETAIVTPIAGTTRDLIKETIQIDGLVVNIIDTAGLRNSADIIEQEGIKRSKIQQKLADKILLIVDVNESENEELSKIEREVLDEFPEKVTVIFNKVDLINKPAGSVDNKIYLSAKQNEGIELLRAHLKSCVGYNGMEANSFIARERHVEALKKTRFHCIKALEQYAQKRSELVAQELRMAQDFLGEIVGKMTSDELLGKIFSSFCIGK